MIVPRGGGGGGGDKCRDIRKDTNGRGERGMEE